MRRKLLENLIIKGAREHNLKNIDLSLPRGKLIVISGLSGSGKSSLAFDTIFAEGRRRYMESLSAYARQFLGKMDKPDVDYIEGLSPSIAIEQKTTHKNPRSTVGTITEIYDYYRLLFARIGHAHCPKCGREIKEQDVDAIIEAVESGHLSGVGLDVLEGESAVFFKDLQGQTIEDPAVAKLVELYPRVLVTPHMGSYTDEAVLNMIETSFENIKEYEETDKCKFDIQC